MARNVSSFSCSREEILCTEDFRSLYLHYIANVAVNAFLAIISVLGNSLVLAAYYYASSLRRPIYLTMMSLAVTDLLCGLAAQPLYIWEKLLMTRGCSIGSPLCGVVHLEKFFTLFLIGTTVFNISAIALDRYMVIRHYSKYSELVTKVFVRRGLVAIWVAWFIAAVLGTMRNKVAIILGFLLSANILATVILYFKVLREIKRAESSSVETQENVAEKERKASERKIAKLVALIFGSLILSFTPFIVFGLFASKWSRVSKEILLIYAGTSAFSNSASNVFIYYWENQEMRVAMLNVIGKLTRNSAQNQNGG